ncbi:hypothetical protein BDV97DRAFT_11424 [Delphinella strobiligena]|nr:hypothetical protein BDV97DRAFT_11424 [Delphinella strobiligena]
MAATTPLISFNDTSKVLVFFFFSLLIAFPVLIVYCLCFDCVCYDCATVLRPMVCMLCSALLYLSFTTAIPHQQTVVGRKRHVSISSSQSSARTSQLRPHCINVNSSTGFQTI